MNKKIASQIHLSLERYISPDSHLDGEMMQKEWFPEVNADIFLSHSHRNEDIIIGFAGWLYHSFGLVSFIDSQIWGYSNDLLREIDNKFCFQEASNTYNYNLRNESTSHVHMMLLIALAKMLNKTECLFFINTTEAITTISEMINRTKSPWIYSEIALSKMIRIQKLKRRETVKLFESSNEIQKSYSATVPIDHTLDLEHLTELRIDDMNNWHNLYKKNKLFATYREYPLDLLYYMNLNE